MRIGHVRISCCIPEATNTHLEYGIIIVFPIQQRLLERTSILRYTYIVLSCYYIYYNLQLEKSRQIKPDGTLYNSVSFYSLIDLFTDAW